MPAGMDLKLFLIEYIASNDIDVSDSPLLSDDGCGSCPVCLAKKTIKAAKNDSRDSDVEAAIKRAAEKVAAKLAVELAKKRAIGRGELMSDDEALEKSLDFIIERTHGQSKAAGWWTNLETGEDMTSKRGEPPKRNIGEALMLIVSEATEAMEGHRKGLQDEHLPEFTAFEVELADIIIRTADLAGGTGARVAEAVVAKLNYNRNREDHKIENRIKKNGKKY